MALGPKGKLFVLGMYISCCLCPFYLRRAPNANSFFSRIRALDYAEDRCSQSNQMTASYIESHRIIFWPSKVSGIIASQKNCIVK